MINRINLILRAKNINARQFAEEIGIQPSGMSHILGGRNNPSLDFFTKVIRRYPEIDANWLLLGRGEMYTSVASASPLPAGGVSATDIPVLQETQREASLFPELEDETSSPNQDTLEDTAPTEQPLMAAEPSGYVPTYMAVPPADHMSPTPSEQQTPGLSSPDRRLERLLFIYSDGTFGEYLPAPRKNV